MPDCPYGRLPAASSERTTVALISLFLKVTLVVFSQMIGKQIRGESFYFQNSVKDFAKSLDFDSR